jgi:acetylornithine deacetylase/succinyl-diaminopimelate desuccinylase-like protein
MENNLVSKEEISKHIRALSFPRRSGSPGEEKAFQYILEHFQKYSLTCDIQKFSFASSSLSVFSRLIPFTILALLAAAAFLSTISTAAALSIVAAVIAVFLLSTRWNFLSERMAGRSGAQTSNNIIARIPNEEARKEFVFLAHYDSKSQILPLYLRVASTFLFFFGFTISLAGIISVTLNAPFLSRGSLFYPLSLCLIAALCASFNVKGNLSPGSIDNASGIALLLELSRIIQSKQDMRRCAYTFVATGAEEEGLNGAFHFIRKYHEQLKKRETLFINFDGAGASGKIIVHDRYGIPPIRTSKTLSKIALLRARERQMDVARGYLPPGVGVDAIPIAYHGFDVISFSSRAFSRATFSIHSSRDVPENIDPDSLEQLATLALALSEC